MIFLLFKEQSLRPTPKEDNAKFSLFSWPFNSVALSGKIWRQFLAPNPPKKGKKREKKKGEIRKKKKRSKQEREKRRLSTTTVGGESVSARERKERSRRVEGKKK